MRDFYYTLVMFSYSSSFIRWESEGYDRPDLEYVQYFPNKIALVILIIRLPGLTNRLVSEVLEVNPNAIVVNQSGSSVTFPWIDEAHTVLQVCYLHPALLYCNK